MNKNISEIPDNWVILKLPNNVYKVFATWIGGYLYGDSWKLNSGIHKVEQDENFYYFIGYSGSCYKCNKKSYGIVTSFGLNILNKIIGIGNGNIKLMDNVENWENII